MRKVTFAVDTQVPLDGSSIWSKATGLVHVTQIELETYSTEELEGDGDDKWASVYVTHNREWDIYTDKAFEAGITALVHELTGINTPISFTEQGEQEDELAFMENSSHGGSALGNWIRYHGTDENDVAHITKLQRFLRGTDETEPL